MTEPKPQADGWEQLPGDPREEPAYATATLEEVALPDANTINNCSLICAKDYVNVMVLNGDQEVLVLEGYKQGVGRISWQMLGGYLEKNEDPLTAVKRELLQKTGYHTTNWVYLGSYVLNTNRHVGVGHLFCAQNVQKAGNPIHTDLESVTVKWVPLKDIRYALVDGRLAIMSHAMTVSLAMLTLL
jgi:ADP-ribose pyrophosphatase